MYKYITVLLLANLLLLTNIKANTVLDSIGVENLNGSKVIIHQIVKNDTYYSIGRRYNVSPKEIMTFNDNKYLQVGVLVKVPTKRPFDEKSAPVSQTTENRTAATGTTFITHTVQPKENLNMISKRYGTTVNEIKRVNDLRSINLSIGQELKIPAANELAATETATPTAAPTTATTTTNPTNTTTSPATGNSSANKPVEQPKPVLPPGSKPSSQTVNKPVTFPAEKSVTEEKFIEHTVASNETIYSIATTYRLTIDQLKAKNNLQTNSLRIGQKLLISGQYPSKNQSAASEPLEEGDSTIKDPALRGDASRYGLNQIDEKGTAVWITDQDLDPVKMLVLHRSAPVGTIVKVTNPMTNRSAFAKVVGKFTENESTKDVIIVMTKAVAESVGAIDKRFFCNLTYSGQENEQ
jgi:peptidoglycan endopeptidase LytF